MASPHVSVVILSPQPPPTLLVDLDNQFYRDFEVIVAKEPGIVNAMNRALEKAAGKILVRIDDDVALPSLWLYELIKPFSDPAVAGVTGPTFVPQDRRGNRDSIRMWEKPGWFLRWLADDCFKPAAIHRCGCVSYDSNYEERFSGKMWTLKGCDHLEGTNWAMRTDLIRKVGGFDPAFDGVSEWFDTDVEQKVKKLGWYYLVYNPEAYLFHLLEKGPHYNERFAGCGRIKNWLRYHRRHSRFHWKMGVFLIVWMGYFVSKFASGGIDRALRRN